MKAFLLFNFNRFCGWVKDLLSDNGSQSTMRLIMVATWGVVLLAWMSLSMIRGLLLPLPESIMCLLGLTMGGKFAQSRYVETRPPQIDTPPGA